MASSRSALRTRRPARLARASSARLAEGPVGFYPHSLERGLRSERALKLAIAEMYVQGVSTRRVAEITRELCGLDVCSAQVSRARPNSTRSWSRGASAPRALHVPGPRRALREGPPRRLGRDCAVLVAIGVREDGKRSILGVCVSLSEAEVHWREFLESLQERGLRGVKLIISDDHEGLKAALRAPSRTCPGSAASSICSRTRRPMCRTSRCAARWPRSCAACSTHRSRRGRRRLKTEALPRIAPRSSPSGWRARP